MKHQIENSIILITGATGTFGQAFLDKCINKKAKEIRIFSRDEKKQYELKQKYRKNNNIKYYIGDIRDFNSIDRAMTGVDYVFHAAAMKQVPSCELNPEEAVKTNILGSGNVINSAIKNKIKKVIVLSTDKAVYPTSMMGLTKAAMEKIALAKALEQQETEICITRFCNLISSNGSVVPLFMRQIKNNQPLTLTDPLMLRFFMSLDDAIQIVEQALEHGKNGEIFIKKAKACTIENLIKALLSFFEIEKYPIEIIGPRPGEKREELLITDEEKPYVKFGQDYLIVTQHHQNTQFNFDYELLTIDEIIKLLSTIEVD